MKEKSCVCTLITQLSLCVAVYIALNSGSQQKHSNGDRSSEGRRRPMDMYFMTVAGGIRTLQDQTLLLKQMVKVAKIYKACFIVNISELGESDPLLQNATWYPELQKVPWYTIGAGEGQEETYFLKKIEIPDGQTLDIIALNTRLFQDPSNVPGNDQIEWLARTLKESDSDWRIVVGFHQLVSCDHNKAKAEDETPFELLHKMLLHYGVDGYISRHICAGHVRGGTMGSSNMDLVSKGPSLTAMDQKLAFIEAANDGYLLHRVSTFEMVTFLVKLTGEVSHRLAFQQKGKAVM